jgi:hypothetical protein
MRKKILAATLSLVVLASGTAYAAGKSNIVSVLVNGKPVQSGTIIDGSTMLPLRAIGEALGVTVDWDNAKKQASITTPQQPVQEAQTGLTLEQLNKIGGSVGLVYAYNGNTAISQGSGFVVDNDIFVTNYHVADGASQLVIRFGDEDTTVQVSDAVIVNKEHDIFAVKLEGRPSLSLNTATPENKDKVYGLGYPSSKFTITEGMYIAPWGEDRWTHSAKTDPGASGGILINEHGEVIGITSTSNVDGAVNTAIRSSILQAELDKL